MIVASVRKHTHTHISMCAYHRGLGTCPPTPPRKVLNLDPLRLLLTQSGTRLLFNTCDETIITILNFKISGGEGNFQGSPPHLSMKPCHVDNLIFEAQISEVPLYIIFDSQTLNYSIFASCSSSDFGAKGVDILN